MSEELARRINPQPGGAGDFWSRFSSSDRLCGLVVRVSGYQTFWVVVGLERGPLSLVRSIEELLE